MGEPPGKKARTSDRVKSPMIEQTIKMNGKVKKGQQPTQNRKRVNPEEQTENIPNHKKPNKQGPELTPKSALNTDTKKNFRGE